MSKSRQLGRRTFLTRSVGTIAVGGYVATSSGTSQGQRRRSNNRGRNRSPAPNRDSELHRPTDEKDLDAFVFSRLKFQSMNQRTHWYSGPDADDYLLNFVSRETNIRFSPLSFSERTVDIDDQDRIFNSPFLFMTSQGTFRLTPSQIDTLNEFFKRGGFLYGDECAGSINHVAFYKAFENEMSRVIPGSRMKAMPLDHRIYSCFFKVEPPAPKPTRHMQHDLGLFLDERLVAFLTPSDVHCGWNVALYRPFQKKSLMMGANIMVYALTH